MEKQNKIGEQFVIAQVKLQSMLERYLISLSQIGEHSNLVDWTKGLIAEAAGYCADEIFSWTPKPKQPQETPKSEDGVEDLMIETLKEYVDFAQKKKSEVSGDINKIEANIKKLKYDICMRETKNEQPLGGLLFEKEFKIKKDVILDDLNGYLKSQGKVAEQLDQQIRNFKKINQKLNANILQNFQIAAKWYASGNYFSTELSRKSGFAGQQLNQDEQSLVPIDEQNQFVEIESIELEEIWFNNWRWGFKFKNGLQSDFDSDCVLKKFKLPLDHPHIYRVDIHSDSWDGQQHCLIGLKFFDTWGKSIIVVGEFNKAPSSITLFENEKIIGVFSYKHPKKAGGHVDFQLLIGRKE